MPNNRGAVLLEVSVALAVLAVAGIALVEVVDAGLREEREARQIEVTLAAEERLLSALALLGRSELDQRLGRRPVGEFIVNIQRLEPTLYRIAVLDSLSPYLEDLVTVVHRPEPVP